MLTQNHIRELAKLMNASSFSNKQLTPNLLVSNEQLIEPNLIHMNPSEVLFSTKAQINSNRLHFSFL